MAVALPALTSLLALVMAVLLVDQWRERRRSFQLAWAFGMFSYAIGSAAEAVIAANGCVELADRAWYLAGALWTPAWLGLGTALLLSKTRFGYMYAVLLLFSGLIALVVRNSANYAGAGPLPLLYLLVAVLLALAIGIESYFGSERWARFAVAGVIGATILSIGLMAVTVLPAPGCVIDANGQLVGTNMPGYLRLLAPVLNFTGGLSLLLGAVFSAYVFIPKKRVLDYSLDAGQKGDVFLFNLLIAPIAIVVNLVACRSPGARDGKAPLPGAGDDPDRDRGVHPDVHRFAAADRVGAAVRPRQVLGRRVPARGVPRLDRGVPRDPGPVHEGPAGRRPPRAGLSAILAWPTGPRVRPRAPGILALTFPSPPREV